MKKSQLLQIIKEEIQDIFKSDNPKAKYKKGDKINYRGTSYTVKSDNGYVVTGVDARGKEKTLNHNQLSQGMVSEESTEKEYSLEELPTYSDLPETNKEVPRKDMRYVNTFIILPSLNTVNGFLYSKEKAKEWIDKYKAMFKGEEPKFIYKTGPYAGKDNIVQGEIISSAYLAHQQKIKDYESSPEYRAAQQRSYDDLKYKGD